MMFSRQPSLLAAIVGAEKLVWGWGKQFGSCGTTDVLHSLSSFSTFITFAGSCSVVVLSSFFLLAGLEVNGT